LARRRPPQVRADGVGERAHAYLPARLRRKRLEVRALPILLRHTHPRAPRRANRCDRIFPRSIDRARILPRLPEFRVPRRMPVDLDRRIDLHLTREVPRPVNSEVHPEPVALFELEEHLL